MSKKECDFCKGKYYFSHCLKHIILHLDTKLNNLKYKFNNYFILY